MDAQPSLPEARDPQDPTRHSRAYSARTQVATCLGSSPDCYEVRRRLDDAHRVLAETYSWFTEGFDTKDLQEAKALLEELSH